jgi:NADPH-dependent 2,4-dienoyl-CoA reductase/sulfur reductase-like enzyme
MKLIIIGAVAAGAKAAAKARRLLNDDSKITIYTDDTHVSYSSCGIPYFIEGNFEKFETLLVRSPEEFEESGVRVLLRHKVIKILPESKQVVVMDIEKNKHL